MRLPLAVLGLFFVLHLAVPHELPPPACLVPVPYHCDPHP
jgi:hypothetical protein